MNLHKKLWLWGQNPGSHHAEANNLYNLPGENKMSPIEGAQYLHIPNMCRVVMEDRPAPPFDNEAKALVSCEKVAWSILGSGGSARNNNGGNDLDEVLELARKFPNIVAGIMDDFMRPERMAVYTPEIIREYKERLHQDAGRHLDLWTVIYTHELSKEAGAFLEQCDVITLWTWCAKDLVHLEENLNTLRSLCSDEKQILLGCYMWDYGDKKPMTMDLMKLQLDIYHRWLTSGEIDGIIFCSNCIADLGLDTVDYTKKWIEQL